MDVVEQDLIVEANEQFYCWKQALEEIFLRKKIFENYLLNYCCINNFLNNTFFHSWIGENFRVNYFPFVEKLYGM